MSTVALLEDSDSDPELDELLSKGPIFLQNFKPSTPPKRATDPITSGMKEEETVMNTYTGYSFFHSQKLVEAQNRLPHLQNLTAMLRYQTRHHVQEQDSQ